MGKRRQRPQKSLQIIHPRAAGIDIGSRSHWAAIDSELTETPVREFAAYTDSLNDLADWLLEHDIETVAMESTGVYWVALFDILQERGLDVWLVDSRSTKQVAGRKSDVSDCQWIQQLHSYGLLKRAFVPEAKIATVRSYMRQRDQLVASASREIHHMQKELELMNIKLTEVVSDVTGQTGMAIIESILEGERDPDRLSEHRHPCCKRSREEIARALHGTWSEQHLFALEQARDRYRFLGEQIQACDRKLDKVLRPELAEPTEAPTLSPKRDRSPHPFRFDAKEYCYYLAGGVDLTTIDGIGVNTALTFLSETGADMTRWKSAKSFASWLGVAPNVLKSGGKVLRSRSSPNNHRAATALRLAAQGLANSKSALGAFYRRLRARIGAPKAITATANKLARIIYSMLCSKRPYNDIGQAAYDARFQKRRIRSLIRMAEAVGAQIILPEPV